MKKLSMILMLIFVSQITKAQKISLNAETIENIKINDNVPLIKSFVNSKRGIENFKSLMGTPLSYECKENIIEEICYLTYPGLDIVFVTIGPEFTLAALSIRDDQNFLRVSRAKISCGIDMETLQGTFPSILNNARSESATGRMRSILYFAETSMRIVIYFDESTNLIDEVVIRQNLT